MELSTLIEYTDQTNMFLSCLPKIMEKKYFTHKISGLIILSNFIMVIIELYYVVSII